MQFKIYSKDIVYLSLLIFTLSNQSVISQTKYTVEHPKINEQLSNYYVNYIHQDYFGFIWLCTNDGLMKYDGYKLFKYTHFPTDSNSIASNNVYSIYEDPLDSGKVMWIGTSRSLSKFNRVSEKFNNYYFKKDSTTNKLYGIGEIIKDSEGNFWLGGNGLKRFNETSGEKIDFCSEINKLIIYSVIEDHQEIIWAGSNLGLIKLDPKIKGKNNYKIFPVKKDNPFGMNRNMVSAVYEDGNDVLWIGTYEGIYNFNTNNNKFVRPILKDGDPDIALTTKIKEDNNGNIWASGGFIVKINKARDSLINFPQYIEPKDTKTETGQNNFCIDNSGIIWISLGDYGIRKLILVNKKIKHLSHDPNNEYSLPQNHVTSFVEDNEGGMWLGTEGDGLVKYDKEKSNFYIASGSPIVYNISKDPNGVLWFSCLGALGSYNPKTGLGSAHFGNGLIIPSIYAKVTDNPDYNRRLRNRLYENIDPSALAMRDASNGIYFCYVDSKGTIWSIHGPDNNLFQYDKINGKYIPYNIELNGKLYNSFSTLFDDSEGTLWLGTYGDGLLKQVNNKNEDGKDKFITYTKDRNNNNSLCSNYILDIAQDSLGILWIGTPNGISKFDKTKDFFSSYSKKDGLPSNKIAGIVIDDDENIWISSDNGLSKLESRTEKIINYNESDGLQSNIFSNRSRYKDSEGNIYFGGRNGFNIFKPSDIQTNSKIPDIRITEFRIFNKIINPDETSPLKKSLEFSKELVLEYDQDVFTLGFSTLDYKNPENNLYKYKMENVDPTWVNTDANQRFATYTKLAPGKYKFRVKGSNNNRIWNETGAEIDIIILPPWWKTFWAYALYLILITTILYSLWKFQTNRLKLKHQLEIEHFQAVKYQDMDKLKSKFFTNISHEFRTPLTLILGITKKLSDKLGEGSTKYDLTVISRNALRLKTLVNQLLDLSKLEAGKLKLDLNIENIIPLLRGMVFSFKSLAETKNITLNLIPSIEILYVNIDRNQFEKIINNLLINAFKFTPADGKIEVNIDEKDFKTIITITDTGIGIPEERLAKIFDRFYQADDDQTVEIEGTGIGLALTKELVELHDGDISVESEEGKGTKFVINLPSKKEIMNSNIIQKGTEIVNPKFDFLDIESETHKDQHDIKLLIETEKPILLIVEDNKDVRNYIKSFFEEDYIICEAVNGLEGIQKSFKYIPDIIISDVMMPKMDGFQLTEKLKTDERTNHIPVILLTARSTDQDKIEGLEIGADDYMMKPFDAEELQIRVRNLIIQKLRIREHFKKQEIINFSNDKVESSDKKFLRKASQIVDMHMSDSKFGVEQFSDEIGMSRQQLTRKFKSIIGYAPSDFIKTVRMGKATKLIKQNFGNISEIAYEVGFENPAYFAQSFKKHFGISPSQFEQKNKN